MRSWRGILHRRFLVSAAVAVAAATVVAVPGAAAATDAVSVAPYVDMGQSPTPSLSAMASDGGLKSLTLGFVTSVGCKASWFNAHDPASKWQADEIGKIRSAGGDVKVSFGGATGIELAQDCPTPEATAAQYDAVIDAYQLNYIDLDIEGAASADPVSVDRRSAALAQVQQQHPGLKISLTLPVLPTGLTGDGVNVLASAHKAGVAVDLVNVMAMDYGAANSDMGHAATQAAQATQQQVKSVFGVDDAAGWKMIGVTPMLGVNDSAGETFSQQDAHTLVDYANQMHLGMLSFWEEGRDANACTGSLSKCTNIPQSPYEFSKIFASFAG